MLGQLIGRENTFLEIMFDLRSVLRSHGYESMMFKPVGGQACKASRNS